VLVKDINPGVFSSNLQKLVNADGTLFFVADDGVHGAELWKSNGTAAGTVLVKDVWPGNYSLTDPLRSPRADRSSCSRPTTACSGRGLDQ
jgi:ELWxxDGT repeat protein